MALEEKKKFTAAQAFQWLARFSVIGLGLALAAFPFFSQSLSFELSEWSLLYAPLLASILPLAMYGIMSFTSPYETDVELNEAPAANLLLFLIIPAVALYCTAFRLYVGEFGPENPSSPIVVIISALLGLGSIVGIGVRIGER